MTPDPLPIPLVDEILIDLTNFLARPLRTGIQRYFTEILSHWPKDASLLPFTLARGREIAVLDPAIFTSISGFIRAECQSELELFEEEIRYFRDNPLRRAVSADLLAAKAILLPEVTYDPRQLAFYDKALSYFKEKVFILVYDFIPWLRPDLYPDLDFDGPELSGYIDLLQKADNFIFISHKAKRDAESRVLRRRLDGSLVLGGGADGLGRAVEAAPWPGIAEFAMVGTIQQRKRHFMVLDVCEALWAGGARFHLTFVGAPGDFLTREERERLDRLARSSPWFRWEDSPLDSELVEILRRATATLYVSVEEGLGLPVLESLWLGVPVIAADTLPVLDFTPRRGMRLIDPDRPDSLAEAIKAFLSPGFAPSVRAEIDRDALPSWRAVAARLQGWLAERPGSPGERVPARRRVEMTRALHDLRLVPPQRLAYETFTALFGRPPTGAELTAWLGRRGRPAEEVGAMVEWLIGEAGDALSAAERSAWLMSLEAAQGLPEDFSFDPPATAVAALIRRGAGLLRDLLGCSDEQFLPLAYHSLLHRPPDPPGEADFRQFLAGHAHQPRWARGMAVKSLVESDEWLALSGLPAFSPVIEDLMAIDVFCEPEVTCLGSIIGGKPSRWLFARLLELRGEAFLRLARALVQGRRVSEVAVEIPPREMSRVEKLVFLSEQCRQHRSASHLAGWIDLQLQAEGVTAPRAAAAETPTR